MSSLSVLEKLLGSAAKVKIMRLFLFSPQTIFSASDVARRANISPEKTRQELKNLAGFRFIRHKKGKKRSGWTLNHKFANLEILKQFFIEMSPVNPRDVLHRIRGVQSIKLLVLSGVFTKNSESQIDILIVGDKIRKGILARSIRVMESELGKELRYTFFDTAEFQYRLGMYDKLIRDVLDFPHTKVVNKFDL